MTFYSTEKKAPDVDFKTALFQGIAPDGGLYMPRSIRVFTEEELEGLKTLQDTGFAVMRKWIDAIEISDENLRTLIGQSFTFSIPLVPVGKYSVLELFHGQTMAFKDIAARVLARLFAYYLEKERRSLTILVATSGDTGGAIAQAFSGVDRVKVVVLYPEGKVSALQEEQLTRVGENVLSLTVAGDFDDCQNFVKKAFQDQDLQKYHLSTANSINVGRLLPQIIYYVWAYCQLKPKEMQFVVPSGNMGNATAALLAKRMGIPIASLLIVTNENDAAVTYYKTGIYHSKKTIQTLSTAMDIGNPSNFERILELFHHDHEEFRKFITAMKITDTRTIATIKKVFEKYAYLMDFHTAVGYCAAEKSADSSSTTVVASTASPLKFAKEMKEKTGIMVDNAGMLALLRRKEKRVIQSNNNYESIKRILTEKL